jgi:transposase
MPYRGGCATKKIRTVGVLLGSVDNTEFRGLFEGFRQSLSELGWVEGVNIRLDEAFVRCIGDAPGRVATSRKKTLQPHRGHGIDAAGSVVIRRQLKRRHVLAFFQKLSPCLVGIEACATSHHWSRELQALGHTVRLIPPAYVRPYVKRQKNDCTDAEAICEAVGRPNMRFVPTKTIEQQSGMVLYRTRSLLIRQQTSVVNAIRSHLAEFGIVASIGRNGLETLLSLVASETEVGFQRSSARL